jgi:hypothetical protein
VKRAPPHFGIPANTFARGAWLAENGCDDLGAQERRALVKIGEHIDLAREVFTTTSRLSVQHIWLKEIEPQTIRHVAHGGSLDATAKRQTSSVL